MTPHSSPSRSTVPLPRPPPPEEVDITDSRPGPSTSPIINRRLFPPSATLSPALQPQYAEDFTPLKLRRRKRQHVGSNLNPGSIDQNGPTAQGYLTTEGELYRGTVVNPLQPAKRVVEEDAITFASTTSSSSNWSWGSGISAGRRAKAVIERVGGALRGRRGSSGSSSSDSTTPTEALRRVSTVMKRKRTRRLSRTISNATEADKPKRQQVAQKREFMLLLPPQDGMSVSNVPTPRDSLSSDAGPSTPMQHSDRVIHTPSLPVVLEHIKSLRVSTGFMVETPPDTPVTPKRGGSAPGRQRRPKPGQHPSFLNPPIPRPVAQRTQSRLQVLRQQSSVDVPKRPMSATDLLSLRTSGMSSPNLDQMRESSIPSAVMSSPLDIPASTKGKEKATGCWWLDVGCPSWEDLRDLGELLALHPLTLEDILQQDPREKLDLFDSLGYYVLVVRALDEGYFKYTPGSSTTLVGPGRVAEVTPPKSGHAVTDEHHEEHEHHKEGRRRGWGMGRAAGRFARNLGEKVEIVEDEPGKEGLEGVGVGAVNVYLVVFADGIVSFHFEDISKHTKRVLERILSNASAREAPGSDWIAHGLLDSIVDAFFPLIRYVDGEVDDIDSLTIDPSTHPHVVTLANEIDSPRSSETLHEAQVEEEKAMDEDEKRMAKLTSSKETVPRTPLEPKQRITLMTILNKIGDSIPSVYFHVPRPLIYLKLFFLPVTNAVNRIRIHDHGHVFDRSTMLKRITDMRKLVTGLTRTLGSKAQVVAKLRKRAADTGGGVEAYIGDVEDHILLLQTSLYHYEYILSHCQPAYLSHLAVSSTWARGGTDQAILALSTVTIGVLPMQMIVGLFSMNIALPQNGKQGTKNSLHKEADGVTQSPFNWFAGIVVGIFFVACGLVTVIRFWRWQARVKWAGIRGVEVPDMWDGYWGWK